MGYVATCIEQEVSAKNYLFEASASFYRPFTRQFRGDICAHSSFFLAMGMLNDDSPTLRGG